MILFICLKYATPNAMRLKCIFYYIGLLLVKKLTVLVNVSLM